MKFRQYQASPEAVRKARDLGIYGDTQARLLRMARRSAPCTSSLGNRRFLNFVLQVSGDVVMNISRLDIDPVQ